MRYISRRVAEFLRRDDGPTAVEYAIMLALIVVGCIAAITTLGSNTNNTFSGVALAAGPSAAGNGQSGGQSGGQGGGQSGGQGGGQGAGS